LRVDATFKVVMVPAVPVRLVIVPLVEFNVVDVITPEALRLVAPIVPTVTLGVPERPVALPVTLPVKFPVTIPTVILGVPERPVALPVTFPTNEDAVIIPEKLTPVGTTVLINWTLV